MRRGVRVIAWIVGAPKRVSEGVWSSDVMVVYGCVGEQVVLARATSPSLALLPPVLRGSLLRLGLT